MTSPLTRVARALGGPDLAREYARQRLADTRAERASSSLLDAVRLGRAVGLSASEMQRMAGCSRQTIYNAVADLDRRRTAGTAAPLDVLTALVSMGAPVAVTRLAETLEYEVSSVVSALLGLAAQGLCVIKDDDPRTAWSALEAEPVIRAHFNELFLARPDRVGVYLHVAQNEIPEVEAAAEGILSRHEHTMLLERVAPSVMVGPELAFMVYTPTIRQAIEIAGGIWNDIRRDARLDPGPMRIASIVPPAVSSGETSEVLDAFCDSIVEAAPETSNEVSRIKHRYRGGVSEMALLHRCLTAAARVLRRSLDQAKEPPFIHNSDAAFDEYQVARHLRLDAARDRIQDEVVAALDIAIERLGPLPGGRLGGVRTEDVEPTPKEQLAMVQHAGRAVGFAARIRNAYASEELTRIVAGR